MLNPEARTMIARGLGLLGSACIALEEIEKGEEVLRLAVQYAGDGPAGAEIYVRLGQSMMRDHRPGEAIGALRRAANLGADGRAVWPLLAEALIARGRYVAALGALLEGRAAGVTAGATNGSLEKIEQKLGKSLVAWQELVGEQPRD
jgi:cytochrome c-type biogenesis protein CcmH/NrfG